MKRLTIVLLSALVAVISCAERSSPGTEASSTASEVTPRVDLVEAGIRAVAQSPKVLFVQTKLCDGEPGDNVCTSTLTDDEVAALSTRLTDLSDDIRFVTGYEAIPAGQAPIDVPDREFVFVGPPQDRGDGTFWITAGESCGGLCGHGGTYILEKRDGTWVSTGNAPGTGTWIS